jgi:hypothetical protein
MKVKQILCMRFEVLTAVKMLMAVFWVVSPCGPVGRNQCFGRTYCLFLQLWRWCHWFCDQIFSFVSTAFIFNHCQNLKQYILSILWTTSVPAFCECPEIQIHCNFCNQVFCFVSSIHSHLILQPLLFLPITRKRLMHTVYKRIVICNCFGNNTVNNTSVWTFEAELCMALLQLSALVVLGLHFLTTNLSNIFIFSPPPYKWKYLALHVMHSQFFTDWLILFMKEEKMFSVSVIQSHTPQQCSLSASLWYSMTCVIALTHDVNWISSSPQFYFILQMQLNDVRYLESVYWYENFGRESTGMKYRDQMKCQYCILAYNSPFQVLCVSQV